ncbi:MAG TPA: dihydroneopterin aldolase [Candidatus Saccharimonadales bacterium]|nr:dihydroneopterin aldolase [Candidatus Saccharimonadales bacterium]
MIGKIFIKDLLLRLTIGIDDQEKTSKTEELINVTLWVDFKKALETDSVEDSVNYATIYEKILELQEKEFNLQETLVKRVIDICFETDKKILKVKASTEKPHILKYIKSVGVELEVERP